MKTRTAQLGEVCEFIRGVTFPSGEGRSEPCIDSVACLTTSGVQQEVAWASRRFIPRDRIKNAKQVLQTGDILISTANSKDLVGKSCIVGSPPFKCTFGAFVTVARSTVEVHPPFLAYWMTSARFLAWCYRTSSNTTNISNLRVSELEEMPIPLPSLPEQRRIAALLEQADRLRRTRRYALELSDTFLPAAFLEMFGDPKGNPKAWTYGNLAELCVRFSDGPFGSNLKTEHYRQSGVRVIRLQNIGIGDFIDADQAFIAPQHFDDLRKHECLPGDVLIGTLGDPNLRACVQPDAVAKALNKADCIQARPDPAKANRDWLCWLLNMPSTLYLVPGMVHGQTRSRISMGELSELAVPVPPLPLQQRFADLVRGHERLRASQRESLRQAEHLFQSLLHQAFEEDT